MSVPSFGSFVSAYLGVKFSAKHFLLKYKLELQFNSFGLVFMYLYVQLAWLAFIIFISCILLCYVVPSFV
jgi:hypothetical protein